MSDADDLSGDDLSGSGGADFSSDDDVEFDVADLRSRFASASDVNAPIADDGATLLSTAAAMPFDDDAEQLVRDLLDAGADVRDGAALQAAVLHDFVPVVRLLLERGAPVDGGLGTVDTPICIAAMGGGAVFELLLAHGASLHDRSSDGESLMSLAGSARIVVCVARGAPELLADCDPVQSCMLLEATDVESFAVFEALVHKLPDANFRGAFETACRQGHVAAARLLLKEGRATVDEEALLEACAHGLEMLELFVVYGGDALIASLSQQEKLMAVAIEYGQIDVVKRLLALGVDPRTFPESDLLTVCAFQPEILLVLLPHCERELPKTEALLTLTLHGSERPSALAAIHAMLDAGASIKKRSRDDETAAMYAASAGSAPILRLVLERDPSQLQGDDGRTAMKCAFDCSKSAAAQLEVLKVLLDAGLKADFDDAEQLASHGRIEALELLEQHGFDVTACDEENRTLLMAAATCRVESACHVGKWLIDRGVSVAAKSLARGQAYKRNETALLIACASKSVEFVRMLLDAGSDIDATTDNGTTPLLAAVDADDPAVVRLLLDRGAKPIGRNGQSIVHRCQEGGGLWSPLIALVASGVDVMGGGEFALKSEGRCEFLFTLLLLGVVDKVECASPRFAAMADAWGLPLAGDAAKMRRWERFAETRRSVVRQFNYFCTRLVASQRLGLINSRAATICFALQGAQLPALLTLAIVDEACPFAPLLAMHLKWDMIVKIKHFHER